MLVKKTRHLHIEPLYAARVNCVAEEIAAVMALNVSRMFLSNYGIGNMGYASIVPECEKEGLFAFFAVSLNGEIVLQKKRSLIKPHPLMYRLIIQNR